MAFPRSPSDYDAHTEDDIQFYAKDGNWRKKKLPSNVYAGPSALGGPMVAMGNGNFSCYPPNFDGDRIRKLVNVTGSFQTAADAHVVLSVYDEAGDRWFPGTSFQDPSGIIHWGSGGQGSQTWNYSSFGGASFNLAVEDPSRLCKAVRPQILKLKLINAGANQTVVVWSFYTHVVTGEVPSNYYAKCNIPTPLDNINCVNLELSGGATFADGRMTAEVY